MQLTDGRAVWCDNACPQADLIAYLNEVGEPVHEAVHETAHPAGVAAAA